MQNLKQLPEHPHALPSQPAKAGPAMARQTVDASAMASNLCMLNPPVDNE
jgi:hypothetical protein